MTSRARSAVILVVLLVVAVVVPSVLAYAAGCHRNDTQIVDLQRRLTQVEVDLQAVDEELAKLTE